MALSSLPQKKSVSCSSVKGSWLHSEVTDPFNILVSVLELKLLQCCFYFRDLFSRDVPLQINFLNSFHLLLKIVLYFPSDFSLNPSCSPWQELAMDSHCLSQWLCCFLSALCAWLLSCVLSPLGWITSVLQLSTLT